MKTFIAGLVTAVVVFALGGYLFIVLGGMPVAVKSKTLPFEAWAAEKSIENYLKGSDKLNSPVPTDESNLLAGAKVYMKNCAVCHGEQAGKVSAIAAGMFPPPPQMLESGSGEVGYPVGSVYFAVKNGIRLTGMPGFADGLTDLEMWQVSQLLVTADKLSPAVADALKSH